MNPRLPWNARIVSRAPILQQLPYMCKMKHLNTVIEVYGATRVHKTKHIPKSWQAQNLEEEGAQHHAKL